ncbi:MAG: hypothetical protein ACFFG0_50990 [Candidatus Thorarchaeota archaeon]
MSSNTEFLKHIEYLIDKCENEEKSGIFFKLEKDKDPMEILGVLDFLKYKLEKWENTNIFSYLGSLFGFNTVLVIGSSNTEEASNIIKYVYLTQVIRKNEEILNINGKVENVDEIEGFISEEISKNMKVGYPTDPKLEIYLKNHIEKLLNSD